IFGGSGDLNYRKPTPALFNLFIDERMPDSFFIVGMGRTTFSDEEYRAHLSEGVKEFSRRKSKNANKWKEFSEHLFYLALDAEKDKGYKKIEEIVKQKEKEFGTHPNVIFY